MKILRPSASDRWLNCSASIHHNEEYVSKFAQSGTNKHSKAVSEYYGAILKNLSTCPDDTDVGFYVNYLLQAHRDNKNVIVEITMQDMVNEDLLLRGTPDALIKNDDYIEVVDFKSGYQEILPDSNQLLLYAYLAEKNHLMAVKYITVIQNKTIKKLELTNDHRKKISEKAKIIFDKTEYNAGYWCQFCSFKTKCKEYLNTISPFLNILQDPAKMTNKNLTSFYEMRNYLAKYIDDVKTEILKRAKNNSINNFTIETKESKSIDDESQLLIDLIKIEFPFQNFIKIKNLKGLMDLASEDTETINIINKHFVTETKEVLKRVDKPTLPPIGDIQ